jgi:hypothetical protein
MKRIVLVAAVASLLATPVAFSQSASQSVQTPSDQAPKASVRDADFYELTPRGTSDAPKGSFDGTEDTDPHSGTWSTVKGSFEGTEPTNVETFSQDANTGS